MGSVPEEYRKTDSYEDEWAVAEVPQLQGETPGKPESFTLEQQQDNAFFATTTPQHRHFESYHVNLIAIGGTIGTVLYIYMGYALTSGGPLNLFLGYLYWCSVIWCVAEVQKELVAYWPTDTAFSRFAARYLDPAAGFATGYLFFISCIALVIFEVAAFGYVTTYWSSAVGVNPAAIITPILFSYFILNIWSAKYYASAEAFVASGKIFLIVGLLFFTVVAMLGGNPLHDRFGFRYWQDPGPMTAPYPNHEPRSFALFEGFLAAVFNARVVVAGPDYLSMLAGEARNPRKTMPRAFNATIIRLIIFFIGGALAMGVLVPYNDPELLARQAAGSPGGASSPYIIAMNRLQIPFLPDLVNALILTSIYSSGNAYLFCASRVLAQMARDGQAPKQLGIRNKRGVPWIAVLVCCALSLLAYLQMSSSAQIVISYLAGLVGTAQLVTWMLMAGTWIRWNKAIRKQGISRDTLPTRSKIAPYAAWYALISAFIVLLLQSYYVFLKDMWSTPNFFFGYGAPIIFVILYGGWKVYHKTKIWTAENMDVTTHINDAQFTEHFDYSKIDNDGKYQAMARKVLKILF